MSTGAVAARPLTRRLLRRAVRVFDAAATPYGVDRYVELVRPSWSSTEVRAKVVKVERTTPRSVTLTVRPNGNWTGFVAGQYTQLSVEIDGVRQTRCYSMANTATAGDGLLEFSVTAHPQGRVSQHLRAAAGKGLTIGLTPAQGLFTLPDTEPDHLLLISGGSGITPVMSMLRTRCGRGWTKPVTFLHYALCEDDMLYRNELAELAATFPGVTLVRVFTEQPGRGDLDGFLSVAQLDAAAPDWARAEAFVCGPAPLMNSASSIFAGAGRIEHLHTEAFTLTQISAEAGTVDGTVRFGASEIGVPSDGRPLLAQAEAAGLTPLSGCRMGICHTCTRHLCTGVVRDAVTGDLTTGPDALIRICVSVPVGDVEIDL
ncbi:MAG TPA: ferredoxin reductase [Acidimicrobiales bacterium]|nr:ferredoxin reductase [Acidimicrobiales bacterium]